MRQAEEAEVREVPHRLLRRGVVRGGRRVRRHGRGAQRAGHVPARRRHVLGVLQLQPSPLGSQLGEQGGARPGGPPGRGRALHMPHHVPGRHRRAPRVDKRHRAGGGRAQPPQDARLLPLAMARRGHRHGLRGVPRRAAGHTPHHRGGARVHRPALVRRGRGQRAPLGVHGGGLRRERARAVPARRGEPPGNRGHRRQDRRAGGGQAASGRGPRRRRVVRQRGARHDPLLPGAGHRRAEVAQAGPERAQEPHQVDAEPYAHSHRPRPLPARRQGVSRVRVRVERAGRHNRDTAEGERRRDRRGGLRRRTVDKEQPLMEKRGNTGYAEAWLRRMGYQPDTRMQGMVGVWFGWFAANNGWYHYSERRGFRVYKRERASLHPAALVADEWASLLMNESTIISSTSDERRAWMARYFANPTATGGVGDEGHEDGQAAPQPTEDGDAPTSFAMDNADFIARAFAMGTGAWVIEPRGVTDSAYTPDAELRIVRYDATQIVPLTWSADDCTQCAFVGRVEVAGRDYDQCQAHVLKGGTYHILTQLFDTRTHKQVTVEGISADMDTRCTRPLFALVRPAVSNRFYDYCAMGASVYCNAVGAMKVVDEAATSLLDHIRVGRPRTFVDKTLIEAKTDKGPDGSLTKTYYAFGEADDTIFSMNPGDEGSAKIQTVQSDLKADENASAINTGLRLLSVACGFGNGYFSWESHTGLKTAKEVAADNSQLMRSIHRHENALRKSIVRLVNGMADACRSIKGEAVPYGDVTVDFDDSIISDTQSAREMAMSEVGAGIMAPWEYRRRFYGETAEEAKANVPEQQGGAYDMLGDGLA
nr:MAG TPA: portal protein [Caudoviricetes sp.]